MNIVIMSYDNAPEERVTNREAIKEALGGNAFIYVGTSDTCNNFIDILTKYGNDDLLLIEDDVRLCNGFLYEVMDAIDEYEDEVINFHYNIHDSGSTSEVPVNKYQFNQCVFFPKKVAKKMKTHCKQFYKLYPYYVHKKAYEMEIRYALNQLRIEYFIAYEPELVKCLGFESMIGTPPITTHNFIDDIEPVEEEEENQDE
jgi:hypothetical protein